nr:EOG090X09QT [Triops cancriformis]
MAKWGEGDPRWIVEERPDATNVNNWHWTEKNASAWSKDKIKELFVDMSIEDVVGDITLTEIEKMEGDAVANNRKAKLIFFYEWVIDIKFKSKSNNVEGTIHIPNLSEEHDAHEVDVDIAITKGKGLEADAVKEMLRTKGTALIRDKLALYIKSLKEEFSQGLILPTKDKANGAPTPTVKPAAATAAGTAKANEANMANMQRLALGTKLDVKSLELTESFKCQAFELYNALTVTEMVQAFTRSNVKLEASPGGKFSLFEGSISGEFTELLNPMLSGQIVLRDSRPDVDGARMRYYPTRLGSSCQAT